MTSRRNEQQTEQVNAISQILNNPLKLKMEEIKFKMAAQFLETKEYDKTLRKTVLGMTKPSEQNHIDKEMFEAVFKVATLV